MGKQYCHKIPYKTILFIQAFACYCFAGKIRNVWKADNSKVSPNNWIPKKLLCAFVWIQVWRHPNLNVYIQCTHLILISAGRWKIFALVDLLKPGGWFNRSHMETGEWRGLITGRQSLSSCKPHTGLSAPKIRVRRSFVQETLIWQKTDTLPPSSLMCHHSAIIIVPLKSTKCKTTAMGGVPARLFDRHVWTEEDGMHWSWVASTPPLACHSPPILQQLHTQLVRLNLYQGQRGLSATSPSFITTFGHISWGGCFSLFSEHCRSISNKP